MIKVCHVTSVHVPEDVRIFRKECVSLAKAGYDVTLVQQGESYEKDGVHISGFGARESNRLKRMLFTARRAYKKALAVNADIYHLHDPELLPYGMKLKRMGKRVIFDSHEHYTTMIRQRLYLPGWTAAFTARVYGIYERYVLRRIDGLIFPTLKDGKNPFEGMCPHFAQVDNTPLLEELYDHYDTSVPKHERSMVHIGSLSHERGITYAVQAAGRCGCTLYLGGAYATDIDRKRIESVPEYSCVRYLGVLSRPQVLRTIQQSQIGMATLLNVGQYNQYDNLATKTYEYMSLGVPVILSRAPYNEKVLEKYRFGICVDPESVEEISAAAGWLLDHPEEARRMGENGRRAVKEVFNWDVEEKKLLALYREILDGESG